VKNVKAELQGSFRTELTIGSHRLIADEPRSAGGNDEGPNPYDLLASALATCTAMTLHFYAKREKLALDRVEVIVANERIHAKDCADCESDSGYVHRFDVRLKVSGDLTDEQRQKLLQIAQRCPVYKTLTNEIKVYETLEE
jgi:uncharacterized OsmC-like protein